MIEFKWCMVESVSPLRVQLDGTTTALALDPKLLVDSSGLAVGDMVRCEFSTSGQVIIHGRSSGVRPMRKSFPTKAALDAFVSLGWPGLVGFVEADNSEYLWLAGAWAARDSGWVTPALASGWTATVGETPGYRRYNGVVFLRGRANTTGATQYAFALPVGYRPAMQVIDPTDANTVTVRGIISAAGGVGQTSAAAATAFSFGGLPQFIAEQ